MNFQFLATDYDATLASKGRVGPSTIKALERLRASGRKCLLVTGREIEELKNIFSQLALFEAVVAENGAILYHPSRGEIKLLHQSPPREFSETLRARGVAPLSVGHVIVSTMEPNEHVMLDVIKTLGLELEIIFNKGAVMALPTGVNKATGLKAALHALGGRFENTVAVGDAENDHAFLDCCGCAVAVSNALPALQKHADFVTAASEGQGVEELIDLLIASDLCEIASDQGPREAM